MIFSAQQTCIVNKSTRPVDTCKLRTSPQDSFDEYISASWDLEYHLPKLPEDYKDPHWLDTGAQYSSDPAVDGPVRLGDEKI